MSARVGVAGAGLILAGLALIAAGSVLRGPVAGSPGGMMGGAGVGMMGGTAVGAAGPGPGDSGFVAGTTGKPRVVRVIAGPGYDFLPATITVAQGETITFVVTSMGGLVHEFMVGPAADVAADAAGTPEIDGLTMMTTRTLTFTFDGQGPYAFACHASGHYEAGMRGTITIVR